MQADISVAESDEPVDVGELAETDEPIERHLTYKIARINSKLNAIAASVLKDSANISLSQWRVLAFLDKFGEGTLSQFVRFSGFDKGQMSKRVGQLVTRGLVRSRPSETDSRSQILSLTQAGRATFNRARPEMRKRQASLLAILTASERDALYAAIDKLEAALDG